MAIFHLVAILDAILNISKCSMMPGGHHAVSECRHTKDSESIIKPCIYQTSRSTSGSAGLTLVHMKAYENKSEKNYTTEVDAI